MSKKRWVTTGLYGGGGHWEADGDQKYWTTDGLYGGGGHYEQKKTALSWDEYYADPGRCLPPGNVDDSYSW